jgi:hypothetical protein
MIVDFDAPSAPGPVRAEIVDTLRATWEHLARPGTWWTAAQRLAIAATARAARSRRPLPDVDLPEAARQAAALVAATPSRTTASWVSAITGTIGDGAYVEVVGITSRVVAADTFTRLMGADLAPFPDPEPGEPTRQVPEPPPEHVRTFVPVGRVFVPTFTLSLVPDERAMNDRLGDALYMTESDMADPDFARGALHRTDIELVAATVSYGNECFY